MHLIRPNQWNHNTCKTQSNLQSEYQDNLAIDLTSITSYSPIDNGLQLLAQCPVLANEHCVDHHVQCKINI